MDVVSDLPSAPRKHVVLVSRRKAASACSLAINVKTQAVLRTVAMMRIYTEERIDMFQGQLLWV